MVSQGAGDKIENTNQPNTLAEESEMTEFTVHFEKGRVVGARHLHMEHVEAANAKDAVKLAKKAWKVEPGFRLTRVDHWDEDEGRIVIDW
jgi:hypothetical protein